MRSIRALPPVHQVLGAWLEQEGDFENAANESKKSIELGADAEYRAHAHTTLARCAVNTGDFGQALHHLDKAMEYEELRNNANLYGQRALILVSLNRRQEADLAASTAIGLAPENESLISHLKAAGLPLGTRIVSYD